MSERISAAKVRHPTFTSAEWMASDGRDVPLSFLDAVADQMEADAAELQRLKPLAAEAEALQRVMEHPERHKDIPLWIGDNVSGCFTLDDGRITASTWVELADKLDALAAARVQKPEPEPPQEWCVVRMDNPHVVLPVEWGFMSRESVWRAACGHPAYQRRTAARVVRHPDGSFTVIPEKGE